MRNELTVTKSNIPATVEDLSKFVLIGRDRLTAVRAAIKAIDKVGVASEVYQQKLAEGQDVAEAVLDAEVRLGELRKKVKRSSGGDHKSGKIKSNNDVTFENTPLKTFDDKAQINKMDGSRLETMAAHTDIVERVKAEARENGELVTRQAVLNAIKKEKRKEEIQQQVDEIEQGNISKPTGLFDVIVIDPPWNYGTAFDANGRRVANPYPEMTQEELKELEIPAKDNCVMFLWTTHKFIWDAKELLDTWGFEYRSMLVWDKEKIGMGNLVRMQCEFCLIGIKGKPIFKDNHGIRDIIREPRREHSRKPDAFYTLVNELCVGKKLDFFSREQRKGWCCYGNDTTKF